MIVKLPVDEIVTAIEVVAVVLPEVPVTLMVPVPVAVLLALIVNVVPLTVTVTPELVLVAARVTVPVKPPVSVTVMASVTLPLSASVSEAAEGVSVNPGLAVTVREIVVVAVVLPEVPVIVTVDVPTVAVLLAVKVTTLVEVVGLVPKLAVTPLGSPLAVKVTGLTSVTVIVSVPVAPWTIDNVAAEGFSVKLPPPPGATPFTEQAVPLNEKAVGTAFVLPFQAPLNPMPVTVPPAAMLPL